MTLNSDQKYIGGVAVGMLGMSLLLYLFGLSGRNYPDITLTYLASAPAMSILNATLTVCLIPYFGLQRQRREYVIVFGVGALIFAAIQLWNRVRGLDADWSLHGLSIYAAVIGVVSIVMVLFGDVLLSDRSCDNHGRDDLKCDDAGHDDSMHKEYMHKEGMHKEGIHKEDMHKEDMHKEIKNNILKHAITPHHESSRNTARTTMLCFYLFMIALQLGLYPLLRLTMMLHPLTFDAVAFHMDILFGASPSVLIAKMAAPYPLLRTAMALTYDWLPVVFVILFGLQFRQEKSAPASIMVIWAMSVPCAIVAYQICPISGPAYLFWSAGFPEVLPVLGTIPEQASMVAPAFRNGFPSLHFGGCLMLLFTARYLHAPWFKTLLWLLTGLTVLATLGRGEHYLIDLVVSFPFVVAIQAFCTHVDDKGQSCRRQAIAWGIGLWLVWVVLVRYGLVVFQALPGSIWLVSLLTVGASLFVYKKMVPYAVWGSAELASEKLASAALPSAALPSTALASAEAGGGDEKAVVDTAPANPVLAAYHGERKMAVMFFISGFTGLLYEVVFSRELALTFGGMATATYTVLAVYMGGMALGSWVGGMLMARMPRNGLLAYAGCEMLIGLYCLATPVFFVLIRDVYVFLAQGSAPDAELLVVLRVACGSLVLLFPTLLMGMTLPVMVAELQQREQGNIGHAVSVLYGANTLGAAMGALLSGYVILPMLGITKSTALSAAGSLGLAYCAFRMQKRPLQHTSFSALFSCAGVTPCIGEKTDEKADEKVDEKANDNSTDHLDNKPDDSVASSSGTVTLRVARTGLLVLFLIGCVTMLMEVNYMQLLAVVAGNSVYAFSLMLFSLLLGLGAGAVVARFALARLVRIGSAHAESRHLNLAKTDPVAVKPVPMSLALLLSGLLLSLSGMLLLGVFQWNDLPDVFSAYEHYPYPLGFTARELVRGLACWRMMFPPAVLIGACYPLAMELVTSCSSLPRRLPLLGGAIGLNTLGNIVGAVAGGFVVLPMLGSLHSIWLAAAICGVAGLMLALADGRLRHPLVMCLTVVICAVSALQPGSFDYSKLASGANVYFQTRYTGPVIAHAESLDGGVTSVTLQQDSHFGEFNTLFTNGKFQGNNLMQGEMKAQLAFATIPLLYTTARDNALVIGYGTGVSAHAIREAGFRQLDIVDLSRDLVTLSNKHFSNVNARVSELPGVRFYATDGRNYLLLQDKKYDLISMEITSIWFAGAAALYNREFYALAAKRLKDDGVLQQWVQLHHLAPLDLACILSSVRAEFPRVALFEVGGQGIIIATNNTVRGPRRDALQAVMSESGLMQLFQQAGLSPQGIADEWLLSPGDVDNMRDKFAQTSDFVISTDDNLALEYATPKGNALDAGESIKYMGLFLEQFSSKNSAQHARPPYPK